MFEITPVELAKMSYPDFVAFIGQTNTPPGGRETLSGWIKKGAISGESRVLDLACSTGFSSRVAAQTTGCSGVGVDISADAVEAARREASLAGLSERLEYKVGDAAALPLPDAAFSHVLGGCNFSFIQARERAREETSRVLVTGGKLCVSNFYYASEPPVSMLDQVEAAIGFRPKAEWTREYWTRFYGARFALLEEEDRDLPLADEARLRQAIRKMIFEGSPALAGQSAEVVEYCAERLARIRLTLNAHRRYQRFNVEIWGKV